MSVDEKLPWSDAAGVDVDIDLETDTFLEKLESRATVYVLGTLAWVLLVLAAVADLSTTAYGLEMGARESNPVARALIDSYGMSAAAALKLGAIGVAAAGSILVYAVERRTADRETACWWLYPPLFAAPIWMGAAAWNTLLLAGVVP